MPDKQLQPFDARHQLVVSLQCYMQFAAVNNHVLPRLVGHLFERERIADHVRTPWNVLGLDSDGEKPKIAAVETIAASINGLECSCAVNRFAVIVQIGWCFDRERRKS